ncbi:MAG: hypothetical protein KDE53_30515, partial [Caldilineaceae bacterium]|nr:hypothetical protein [Caldilineaceae bacterium]
MTDTTINVGRDNLGQIAGRDINITYEGDAAYDVRGLENPYLGLAAFTYAERDRYAGREAETQQALTRLTTPGSEQALLFITGASGSGKSSFAQAGLLPALEYHYHQQGFTVKWALFRPGEKPVAALASALRSLHLAADGIFAPAAEYVLAPPLEPPPDNQISILVIDQFEEMFSQSEAAQRKAMFEILAALPLFRQSRLHVIATMRADYLRDLFDDEGLYEIGKDGIDLRAMSEDELKIAIQRPLLSMHATLGKRFQTALLNRLAKDAAEDAAYLPLLQVTLEELWRTGILTADHYESLSHAIRKRAEEVYQHRRTLDGRLVPRGEDEQQMILDSFLDL